MRAIKTKPLRIQEADYAAMRMVATMEGTTPATLVHKAFLEYLQNHRSQFLAAFGHAQRLIASGDVEGLAAELRAAASGHETAAFDAEIAALR